MTSGKTSNSVRPPRPRWDAWPICIVAFFALAIAGCVAFVVFCNLHPADLVTEDYYEQELKYQAQLDRVNRAQALPGTARIAFEPATRRILLTLPATTPGERPTGKIHLYRPSAARQDRELTLATAPDGTQSLDASELDSGLWRVKVTWTAGAQEYYMDQALVIGKGS